MINKFLLADNLSDILALMYFPLSGTIAVEPKSPIACSVRGVIRVC